MESGNSSRCVDNAQLGIRSVQLEIDLNETPVLSPREQLAGDAVFAAEEEEARCRSCREVVVVGSPLGGEGQCKRKRECVECEARNGKERLRSGGVGVLDMNASPPRELDADEEGFVAVGEGGESLSRQAFEQNEERSFGKKPVVHSRTFIGQGQSCTPPVTYPNMLHLENRFNFRTASPSGLDILLQHRPTFESNSRESDLYSTLQGKLLTLHPTPPVYIPHSASDVYLQALREYISQRKGILGDGWHVRFDYCQSRHRNVVVYCGPDGSRFESMADVARYLRLEAADRFNGYGLAHIGSYPDQRGTETSRPLIVNNYNVCENNSRGKTFHGNYPNNEVQNPPGFEMGIHDRTHSRGTVKIDEVESGEFGSQHFNDGFPVQFEEFFILSVGKIDKRPSYHNSSQICPVGYKSSWHDKITGSLFICEVSDGGDMGPVFKVRRCPCTTQSIPDGTTILSRPTVYSSAEEKEEKVDSAHDDENTCIQMILDENAPPNLDDDILLCSRKSAMESSNFRRGKRDFEQIGRGDLIGEFEIEGRSPSLVWELVTKTILLACHEAYQQKGLLQFFCKHDTEGRAVVALDTIGSLSKFCYQAGPNNIPRLIQSFSDFDACLKILAKWLQQDRFGLDVEFVQELIEQLPGVGSCSEYKFLNKRGHGSNIQTVASGFIISKRKNDVQGGKVSKDFMRSCRNPRKYRFPLGKTLTPNLPTYLTGDALQVWEFTRRFSDVLGLEKHISFQELESEFINPWLEKRYPVPHTISKCTGEILRNAHSSLLKVLVSELSFKVALHVYPNHDEDGMPIRGKRKETDNSVFAKKIKLETLPINVLTWPELARRYALAVVAMEDNFESSEIAFRESARVFHCLQGDGGTLSGSLTGVPAMEADALFLAEATKRVFGSLKPKDDLYSIDIRDSESSGSENRKVNESDIPEWAEALEPVKKLPTNVGARIRNCVYEALRKNPPEWAREKLVHSISKEVYKGNASGPTKRAVVEVLGRVRKESPQVKPEKREHTKRASTLSDVVVKQCRIVLRKAAAADKKRVFCRRLGKTFLSPNESDDEGLIGFLGMVSRPLDLRTIDIRLAAGTYGVSLEAFLEDAREVWRNICTAFRDDSDKLDLAEILSVRFEELYETEVLSLVNKIEESGYPNCPSEEAKKEIDDMLACVSDVMLPKAPWDDGVCRVCGMDRDDQSCLLCDVCDAEYHTYCLNPPLPRIPEGNWYCPSCVAAKVNYRNSRGAKMVNLRKKVIPRREFTDSFLERLTKLAQSMELKDYWDLTVEERIVLLRFLCDEALNTTIIRDHLDQCATLSLDLQQKLRLLNSERKNIVYREEVMAANMAKGRINMANEGETGVSDDSTKVMDPILNNDTSNGDDPIPLDSNANHPISTSKLDLNIPSEYANVSQSHKHETSSLKDELSRLNDKIATLEAELLKVQVRKELLGRDSTGRAYWVVCGPGISPQVTVVNGSTAASELKDKEPEEPDMMYPSSWVSYESDGEIRALLEWLNDDDCGEKEVRESIIQWQQRRSRGGTNDSSTSSSSSGGKALESSFLVTKAFTALEKKQKNEGIVYSCQCLEPMWPSRQHCLLCHQTYSSTEDLESHRDTCSPFSPSHENIEVNQDSSKGKRRMTETQVENCPEYESGSSDPRCPFDFEEIKAKFVIQSSLKEMIKDVGLIRTNGTPSFVQSLPPYVSDPALSLLKNEANGCNEPTNLDDQKTRTNAATGVSTDNILHNSPKCVENSIDEEASRIERSRFRYASSSMKNANSVLTSGKSRVLRESSFKQLTGRVSEVLRLLKRNLLEMDAALPEHALRPSRVNSEKRFAWRAFIKSAASIYEMSQATVLLEDMIKTEYLKTDWWYWSTPSAASNIATLSALALRIYTLDAAIFYDRPPKRTLKRSHKVEKGRGNTSKSSTSWVSKDSDCDDGAGSAKFKNRSSKRRKTREVKTSN